MAETILWGALAVGIAMALMRLFGRGRGEAGGRSSVRDLHPYHCVAIESPATACAAARQLKGQRFLASEAPSLPLSGCSSLNCTCVYAHFDDRRHHVRRDAWAHRAIDLESPKDERRVLRGRRKTDDVYHPAN